MSKTENLTEKKPNFLGFTRDDVAIGTAGFVAGVDTVFGWFVPGRMIPPSVEGEMVFLDTFSLLEKYLPGSERNTKK